MKKKIIILISCAVSLIISHILFRLRLYNDSYWGTLDVALISIVLGNVPVTVEGLKALRKGKLNCFALLALSVIISLALGLYSTFTLNAVRNYYAISGGTAFFGLIIFYFLPEEARAVKFEGLLSKINIIALILACLVFSVTAAVIGIAEGFYRIAGIFAVYSPTALFAADFLQRRKSEKIAEEEGFSLIEKDCLKKLSEINAVCFDKTGTLTEGNIRIDKITTRTIKEKELLRLAAALESFSAHPIGKAICSWYSDELPEATEVTNLKGVGIVGRVEGKEIKIVKWVVAEKEYPEEKEWMEKNNNRSKSLLAIIIDGRLEGAIAIGDTVREDAKASIAELKEMGCHTVLMTGDSLYSAKSVGKDLRVDAHYGELLPEGKGELILGLQKEGYCVLSVGDGINDDEAFLQADASICIGENKAADIVQQKPELKKIPYLLALAKRLKKRVKTNIIIGCILSAVGIALCGFGLISALWGALIQLFGILISIFNGERDRHTK